MLKDRLIYTWALACFSLLPLVAFTSTAYGGDSAQIKAAINESELTQLAGNTHPLAQSRFDQGLVSEDLRMEHLLVLLRRGPDEESAMERLNAGLHDPQSASYHKWLSADELGRQFGPSPADIAVVTRWLTSHGLQVNVVHKSGLVIDVSGTAGQISRTFNTEIHRYMVKGKQHIANASDPKIPAALASVVVGVASMNDFFPKPMITKSKPAFTFPCTGCPDGFDDTTQYVIAPPDFDTIYNVWPLLKAKEPITGKGQTIAVLEVSDILPKDVTTFRKAFGLSTYSGTFKQIHPGPGCVDPGRNGAESESALDAEWAGAIAPNANVELASCADTATTGGNLLAAQNLLDSNNPPQIMSLSFGDCEFDLGPGGNQFFSSLWQQADAEGVSVFVSAGDGAAAGCDDFDLFPTWAVVGISANGFASTPFNVATGGTDFLDTVENANSKYWRNSNSATGESAKSYVPEMPWDDSCANSILFSVAGYGSGISFCNSSLGANFLDIIGGSGAPSSFYSKPFWQKAIVGMPSDGKRDLPDVSLFASNGFWNHAIIFCMSDASEGGVPCNYKVPLNVFFNSAGGTSFTAPQFASIQALINQKAGEAQGNPDPIFYNLYRKHFGTPSKPNSAAFASCNATKGNAISSSCIYHDVTVGDNDVPCFGTNNCFATSPTEYGVLSVTDKTLQVAYPAHTGWDFTTGLGSVNVTNLVNNWP